MNHFKEMLNIDTCKRLIAKCPDDEIVILCPNYSINIQSKYSDGEQMDWDFEDFEESIGESLFVNDYDDLCCDPHGVMSNEY